VRVEFRTRGAAVPVVRERSKLGLRERVHSQAFCAVTSSGAFGSKVGQHRYDGVLKSRITSKASEVDVTKAIS
jgi:hypothetical protein